VPNVPPILVNVVEVPEHIGLIVADIPVGAVDVAVTVTVVLAHAVEVLHEPPSALT
jgi:hypothetical protein